MTGVCIHPETARLVQEFRSKADFLETVGKQFPDRAWRFDAEDNLVAVSRKSRTSNSTSY